MHLGLRIVSPNHRNFAQAVALFLSKIRNFSVKAKSVYPGLRKKPLGRFLAKAFEPALRIMHSSKRQAAGKKIENFPHRLPENILVNLHVGLGQCARPKNHIGAVFQFLNHLV